MPSAVRSVFSRIRDFQQENAYRHFLVVALVKEALSIMPALEQIGHLLSWDSVKDLLPLAPSLKLLSIDSIICEGEEQYDDSPADVCLRFSQETADYVALHTPLLEILDLWCPFLDKVDLSSLSHLHTLDLCQASIPKAAQMSKWDLVIPTSLHTLELLVDYKIDLSKFGPSLTPLQSLRTLTIDCPCFAPSELPRFFGCLPPSLQTLDIVQLLDIQTEDGVRIPPVRVPLSLPRLRELTIRDKSMWDSPIFFEFSTAPLLVGLSMDATVAQIGATLKSLVRFPQCIECTLFIINITSSHISHFPAGHTDFRVLNLGSNNDDSDGNISTISEQNEAFSAMKRLTKLRALSMNQHLALSCFANSVTPSLSVLQIDQSVLRDADAEKILLSAPHLATLTLNGVVGLTGLSWLQHSRLETIEISLRKLSKSKEKAIIAKNQRVLFTHERLPKLKQLSFRLPSSQCGDSCPEVIIKGLKHLQILDIKPPWSLEIADAPLLKVSYYS